MRAAAYLGARLSRHASGSIAPSSALEQRRHTVDSRSGRPSEALARPRVPLRGTCHRPKPASYATLYPDHSKQGAVWLSLAVLTAKGAGRHLPLRVWGPSTRGLGDHPHQLAAWHSLSECRERVVWLVRLTTEEKGPEGTHLTQAAQRPQGTVTLPLLATPKIMTSSHGQAHRAYLIGHGAEGQGLDLQGPLQRPQGPGAQPAL